ncbi:hypothetical protein [Actinoplanes teichomyceticus]|uniref:Uncharacterized protein n=1 Tax=Actinoplanes teichomyceticus TaxID=1867 RepID=A0A561VL88_ACTTI|nr:hypothetical protein [Actinoplanes teichomyceticus]TWG12371.1 hypothetical protein FHX34_105238 [Actinoplanes teichomyceticus]GIF13731.1 hypothetical protein Ate01nite_37630 [Actinoplanes teichomyceticus]
MTDDLERMIRDADPYRAGLSEHLRGAEHELLEEIMSTPTPAPARRTRRLVAPLTAAATVTGVLAVSIALADRSPRRDAAAPAAPVPASVPAGAPSAGDAAMSLKAAEENPRLLIGEPGWTAVSVSGFATESGDIFFAKGERTLNMTWYPERYYGEYYADRLHVSRPELARAGDWPGTVFTYRADDFAMLLRPRDGVFAELRTSGPWTREQFDALLKKIKRVDARTWLAALPPEVVTPERAAGAATEILADVPLPPGFDSGSLTGLGANDRYQFGAQVIARVGCGWIAEWERADRAGDAAARDRAADAMRGSRQWQILRWMTGEGDWAEGFWQIADDVAAGRRVPGYREALGCD